MRVFALHVIAASAASAAGASGAPGLCLTLLHTPTNTNIYLMQYMRYYAANHCDSATERPE
jgi:hypothetical protein